jgi:hypothetical protein
MAATLSRLEEGGGMCITERCKGLIHISLCGRGLPSGPQRGPTAIAGHRCRRSVTPARRIHVTAECRSNVVAMDFNHDRARQCWSTCGATYVQQILDRQHVPVERITTGLSDLAQPGGCCGMIPPLVGISGSDLWAQYELAARHREGGTLGQTGDRVDRSASASRPMCVAIAQAAVPKGLHPTSRHRRSVPIPAQLMSTTGGAGRRSTRRAED